MKPVKLPYPVSFQELLEASVKTKPTARTKRKGQDSKRETRRENQPTH